MNRTKEQKIDSINTKFGIRLQGMKRLISTINEPDWLKTWPPWTKVFWAGLRIPTPFALSSQNLAGRFTTVLGICLPKHVELNL